MNPDNTAWSWEWGGQWYRAYGVDSEGTPITDSAEAVKVARAAVAEIRRRLAKDSQA